MAIGRVKSVVANTTRAYVVSIKVLLSNFFVTYIFHVYNFIIYYFNWNNAGVPNLGDAFPWGDLRGIKVVVAWVHLYQWGDAIDVREDGRSKRLGTPGIMIT